ncbi:hypothetical protein G6M89_02325 [Natronolimnobius sp. AArcel1]|uniref:hypothetical protein n=1 Tax=Natronolimnobius sp. AArcel1 TaxID=1679093 RepID=UPI0013EA50C0|nr:hypothetical protein [Natronolimnobius sp. AArcel1]NGM67857.1 hypothetical protein [Natronolimnobius sp. AArcel1]
MNRRHLLATAGVVALSPLVASDDASLPSEPTAVDSVESCGPAALSVSDRLTSDHGDPPWHYVDSGLTPSVAIQNERAESLTVSVDIDQSDALTETYTLESGERIVERSVLEIDWSVTATVQIEGETTQRVAWPHQSGYRHGIAITPDGLEVGWIPPLDGPGDTQHDCYAGDDAPITLRSRGTARTMTVTVVDRCTDTGTTDTVTVAADGMERLVGVLENGGLYDVTIDAEDGPTETYEFDETCWGLEAGIDEDGDLHVDRMMID